MIPKKIHQTAPTQQLSSEERRVLAKNRSLMKGWEFFLHDDLKNQEIMNAAFPEYAESFRAIRRGVVQADIADAFTCSTSVAGILTPTTNCFGPSTLRPF